MFTVGSVLDSGRASAGGAATLTDATKVWGTDLLAGALVRIISGTGVGQLGEVSTNTATVLTMTANWTTNPDATSEYIAFNSATVTGTFTGPTAAAIAAAIKSGVGVPQAALSTVAGGAWAAAAIPAGTTFIDFMLDVACHVIANATATTPFGTNHGVTYSPNLNFRLPVSGCTYLHVLADATAILSWNAIA